jgi:hypothetical protein
MRSTIFSMVFFVAFFVLSFPPNLWSSDTVLDIKANGSDSKLNVKADESVSCTISLDPGQKDRENADWYVSVLNPEGWQSFDLEKGWIDGLQRCIRMPMFSFSSLPLPEPPLKSGQNFAYFALIQNTNEDPNSWLDYVQIDVQPNLLSVMTWNLQIFGPTESSDPDRLAIIADFVRKADIVAIQEIRDASGEAIKRLEKAIDEVEDYEYVIGPRLGRTRMKEQYAFLYDPDVIEILGSYTYDDSQEDLFQREPFIVHVKSTAGNFDAILINIHTDRS